MTNVDYKKEQISNSEWQVMRIVWSLGQATTSELIKYLNRKETWQPSTVKTLVFRLEKKGYLADDGVSRGRKFTPLISESSAMLQAGDNLFASMCAMKNGMVLNHLIEELDLSKKDIEAMVGTLNKKLPDAAEVVACNCLPGEEGHCK
ncbi:CopY/TcrY family copper transport repressor [Oenococcus sp. UCMA 17063]|nr:CopY/TcrY family copper transport repressor [Oenococcus sp. UCMA 17063]